MEKAALNSSLKIHAYFVCFNEEVILPYILDYYSAFCTKIFLYDNLSTDETINIALNYPKVKVIPFDTGGKKNNARHVQIKTQEYKKYSRKGGALCEEVADWVICADIDEIIYHPNLVDVLAKYKEEGVSVPQITGFNMVGREELKAGTPIEKQYMKAVRDPVFDKRMIFSPDFDMAYSRGCHPYGAGFDLMKETLGYFTSNKYPLALLHYKYIGSILYESALKNYNRYAKDGISKTRDGRYMGPGAQYRTYVEKGLEYNPLIGKAKDLFDENWEICFDKFPPTSGEEGVHKANIPNKIYTEDVDLIRDSALVIENYNLFLAQELMKIALRFRPNGPLIIRKVNEYEAKLNGQIVEEK
ncbi:glycosyltransferase family 2 protein [Microbulbifer sp. ANSA003]|uniref:glycosyltransferase family 2 protein n=1 Tax=Microbulbifer sp. ANSA003 TaxID=3243360 RepID=UPI004041FAB8